MNSSEFTEFLDAIGVVDGKLDGIFVSLKLPEFAVDNADGYKILIDHLNIKESSLKRVLEEAEQRGKRVTKIIEADREMTIIYTPRARASH